ncbi:MAG: CPBP family intramembrane metalloprotease [Sphingobacteriales bacterium]|nr:CPBP family intramembrane metalloprotease [Sphingobacteriales bacterium]
MKGVLKTKPAGNQLILMVCIALVGLFIIGSVAGTLILTAITGIHPKELMDFTKLDYNKPGVITYIRGLQVFQFFGLFLLPSLFCAWLFSTNSKKYLCLNRPVINSYWIIGIMVMILAIPFVQWLGELNRGIRFPSAIEQWMKDKETGANKTVMALLSKRTLKDLLLNIICIAGLAAVGEELLFRGVAQRLFIKLFKNPWPGILVTAFLFSAMHLQFYGFFPRFVLGILLGIIYWYSGSLWTAILAHFVYDALLITLAYFNPSMLNEGNTVKLSSVALTAAFSFILVGLAVNWMIKHSRTRYSDVYADDAVPVKDHPF